MFSFYRRNTKTKLLRIGTQQYSAYIYYQFQTVFSNQIIMLYFTSQQKIYPKRKITYKNQNLEQNCVLQESCKTVRCWQRAILLVKGGHCVGDWFMRHRFPGTFNRKILLWNGIKMTLVVCKYLIISTRLWY